MTHLAKCSGQFVVALGDPSQRSHRIAHRRGLEQSLQVFQKRQVLRRQAGAASAFSWRLSRQRLRLAQVLQTASYRAASDLRGSRNRRYAAATGRLRLCRGAASAPTIVSSWSAATWLFR